MKLHRPRPILMPDQHLRSVSYKKNLHPVRKFRHFCTWSLLIILYWSYITYTLPMYWKLDSNWIGHQRVPAISWKWCSISQEYKFFLNKRLPALGSEPGIFCFCLFSHSIPLPLSHSGSQKNICFFSHLPTYPTGVRLDASVQSHVPGQHVRPGKRGQLSRTFQCKI
jgi:hypothetical protein